MTVTLDGDSKETAAMRQYCCAIPSTLMPAENFFKLNWRCQQLRPVLIVLELAPLTPKKIFDDKTNRENSKVTQIFTTPPPPGGERGSLQEGASA